MQFIALLSSLAICAAAQAWAPASVRVTEPVFGLKYDPVVVPFEAAPPSLTKTCPELVNERWDRKMWIFGKAGDASSQFLALGGFYIRRKGAAIKVDTPGAVIHLHGDRCELIGPVREVFDYAPEGISKRELTDLAKDTSCRYVRAFGGKQKFAEELRKQHVSLDGPRSVVLKQAVDESPKSCR